MWECRKVPRLPRETTLRDISNLQIQRRPLFAAVTIGTAIGSPRGRAAEGCEHKSNVERTRLNPQTPKVKREPFATHSGKINHIQSQDSRTLNDRSILKKLIKYLLIMNII